MGHYLAALRGRRGMTLCACVLLALGWWMAGTLLACIAAALVRRDAARIAIEWGEGLKRETGYEAELADWRRALARQRHGRRAGT